MIALLPVVIVLALFGVYFFYSRWRHQRIRNKPFSTAWLNTLTNNLPVYRALPEEQQLRLRQLINTFIADKRFYGCAGLTITDEIRVTIAAEACLLLLKRGWPVYPKLTAILVYPTAFRVARETHQENGTVSNDGHTLLGESWGNGRVILSWDDVENGVRDFSDGHNVVLHEFAHQLDAESGSTNGAPPLRGNSYKSWSAVFTENFEDLRDLSLHGQKTVIDEYGATNPAEFFAVATETFFEKPHQLYQVRPQLYEQLQHYYQLDPREWQASN